MSSALADSLVLDLARLLFTGIAIETLDGWKKTDCRRIVTAFFPCVSCGVHPKSATHQRACVDFNADKRRFRERGRR